VEDRKLICPCYRHPEDIARDGHCICHLFVDDEYEPDQALTPLVVQEGVAYPAIVVYGAAWCRHTIGTRQYLNRSGIPYTYVDVEEEPEAADRVRGWNRGYLSTPTLDIDGRIVTEPSIEELGALLGTA
jgi:mycoredoxin